MREIEVGNLNEGTRLAAGALSKDHDRDQRLDLALAFARAGNLLEARKLVEMLDQEFPLDTLVQNYSLPAIRAAMKLHENDAATAIEILRPATRYDLVYTQSFNSLYPAYLRGIAYIQTGDGLLAASEFQKIVDHPALVGRFVIGALSHLQLARAQAMMGDKSAARNSYQVFLTLWKHADPDIPVYREAQAEYAKLR
jgi:outer membrane protein assembly factor BamD (BamD/ComL family)